jgi:hypothetical protein
MLEIDTGLFVDPWEVAVVKAVGKGQCAIFMKGASPVDGGFLIEKDALEAATDVVEARRDDDDEEPDEDQDEETEEEDDDD